MKAWLSAAILAMAVTPSFAHRLDEYLQGTIISVGKTQLEAQMTLTPGVAVFTRLIKTIDTDGDGSISDAEQSAYAAQVLRDLTVSIDGRALAPKLISMQFPGMDEMKEGRGEIKLAFTAALPAGGRIRKLTIENHHLSGISAYQVNSLVPRDPDIRIAGQDRNYTQSLYALEYVQTDVRPDSLASVWTGRLLWMSPALVIFMTWLKWRFGFLRSAQKTV
jgi:hypothetical protein